MASALRTLDGSGSAERHSVMGPDDRSGRVHPWMKVWDRDAPESCHSVCPQRGFMTFETRKMLVLLKI